jgi:predicted HTH transcriptional regulator
LKDLDALVRNLRKSPIETECVEFKRNKASPEEIGEYISALSNSATYHGKENSYIIWGIDDVSHNIVGTDFDFSAAKVGNEEMNNWLRRLLSDNANFTAHSLEIDNKRIELLIIYKAIQGTVKFKSIDYIRVGSYKKKLKDHPSIEANLWDRINKAKFEEMHAMSDLQVADILKLLDCNVYFKLTKITMPTEQNAIMHYLLEDKIAVQQDNGLYAITNMGAILFSERISAFDSVSRKNVRVIQYKGKNRVHAIREVPGTKGYANGFEGLLNFISGVLPAHEEIEGAFRKNKSVYPEIAIRELVANALIHQDLSIVGAGPTVEIFDDRIEITNPGPPLIDIQRFIDNPPRSRNEVLASLMRRAHICEERGSGWDKVALYCEIYQLPAPKIDVYDGSTKITMFSYVPFNKIPLKEKKWSCYMHACLKQVSGEQMTNTSLRNRFGITDSGKAGISRLISSVVADKLIKPLEPSTAPRYMCYIPFWV